MISHRRTKYEWAYLCNGGKFGNLIAVCTAYIRIVVYVHDLRGAYSNSTYDERVRVCV